METLQELMGKEVYDLLYTHYDQKGSLIRDMDDVLYCDDDAIPQDRISKLESLLTPITGAKSSLVPIEAAKLLASWGSKKAIDYFEYCIDQRIDRLGNLDPHRLHGYDSTYEKMIDSILHYYARHADKSLQNEKEARENIFSPLRKIISLSKELTIDMGGLINEIKNENWKEYLPVLKECYSFFVQLPEDSLNRKWNLPQLIKLYQDWSVTPTD
jgi:hypothetical protein